MLLFAILIAVLPNMVKTHAQLTNWTGHEIRDAGLFLKYGSTQNQLNDKNTVFLVNVGAWEAGDPNCFFNKGGHWGVEASLYEVGTPLYLVSDNGGTTNYIYSNILISPNIGGEIENHVAWIRSGVQQDCDGVIVDRKSREKELEKKVVAVTNWYFYQTSDKNIYWIAHKEGVSTWYYLRRNSNATGARKNVLEMGQYSNNSGPKNDKWCQWKIVTREDLIKRFETAPASYRDIADATFYIYDQGLARRDGHDNKWIRTNITGTVDISNEKYNNAGDSLNYTVGTKSIDTQYTTVGVGQQTYYNLLYGQFFNGEIKRGTGSISQTTDVIKRGGWYMLTCQGFYRPGDGSKAQNAYLYAKVNTDAPIEGSIYWRTAKLPLISSVSGAEPTNLTESGIKFYENRENYSTKVIVWIPGYQVDNNNQVISTGQSLEVGVKLDNSTGSENEWVAVDNFQLKYLGNDFLISEHAENAEFNKEWENRKFETMVLERSFVLGKWNSLVLPVDLNKDQVFTAFGTDVKLAKLEKLSDDGKNVEFKTLNLNNMAWEENAIEKNKLYVINTTVGGIDEKMDWKVLMSPYNGNYRTSKPLYIIQAASFNKNDISEDPTEYYNPVINQKLTTHPCVYRRDGNPNQKVQASPDNYIYVMNKGMVTRYKKPFTLQGLRWWLEFTDPLPNGAKIDIIDEDVEGETTGVKMIDNDATEVSRGIYTIDGKRLPESDTQALPAGVYIVDGKKVLVY